MTPCVVIVLDLWGVGFRSLKWVLCGVYTLIALTRLVLFPKDKSKSFYHTVRN